MTAALDRPLRRYVALGDSLSAGVDGDTPWPDLAAAELRRDAPELRFRNFARVGVTSALVASDQLPGALALRPDLVSLVCGANDVLLSVRPDERAFGRALAAMLARSGHAAPGALVVTATYPPVAPGWLGPRTQRRIVDGMLRFNESIRAAAAARGALCLDWQDRDEAAAEQNLARDGFHPSPHGHRLAAGAFVAAVGAALGRPTTRSDVP